MKHFFIDETTGKLFVIPEMPEEPKPNANEWTYKKATFQN
jgi:hypothetical protein